MTKGSTITLPKFGRGQSVDLSKPTLVSAVHEIANEIAKELVGRIIDKDGKLHPLVLGYFQYAATVSLETALELCIEVGGDPYQLLTKEVIRKNQRVLTQIKNEMPSFLRAAKWSQFLVSEEPLLQLQNVLSKPTNVIPCVLNDNPYVAKLIARQNEYRKTQSFHVPLPDLDTKTNLILELYAEAEGLSRRSRGDPSNTILALAQRFIGDAPHLSSTSYDGSKWNLYQHNRPSFCYSAIPTKNELVAPPTATVNLPPSHIIRDLARYHVHSSGCSWPVIIGQSRKLSRGEVAISRFPKEGYVLACYGGKNEDTIKVIGNLLEWRDSDDTVHVYHITTGETRLFTPNAPCHGTTEFKCKDAVVIEQEGELTLIRVVGNDFKIHTIDKALLPNLGGYDIFFGLTGDIHFAPNSNNKSWSNGRYVVFPQCGVVRYIEEPVYDDCGPEFFF